MKKRKAITRKEATFHMSFSNLADCEIFVPQQQTGAEYKDISREAKIPPADWKAKAAAGGRFVYAEPQVPQDTATASANCMSRKRPANSVPSTRFPF